MSPRATSENTGENNDSELGAAPGAAVSAENAGEQGDAAKRNASNLTVSVPGHDANLIEVADRWATLPDAVRLAVMALVRSASRWHTRERRFCDVSRGPLSPRWRIWNSPCPFTFSEPVE